MEKKNHIKILVTLSHVLFWIGLVFLFYWVHAHFIEEDTAFLKSVALNVVFMFLFYFNSQLLVRFLLEKKKYFLYWGSIILLVLCGVLARVIIEIVLPNSQLPFQLFWHQTRPLAGPFFMTLFWIIFSLLYQLLVNNYRREKRYLEQLNTFSVMQNEFLKNQINPHFLFNNLNNIYSLIQTGSPNSGEMVLKLSDILRYSVYKKSGSYVRVEEELNQVKNFINLYQLKEEDKLNIDIQETIDEKGRMIEPMLLIPLVENCFKHGNIGIDDTAFIRIDVKSVANSFVYTVENSVSPGTKVASVVEGGVGLTNIGKRLALLYGESASLRIEELNNSFRVTLTILWKEK